MFRFISILVFFLNISITVQAQTQVDTLQSEFEELVVIGYEGNRSILETPGSISFINSETITGLNNASLLYGMNTIPGVKMEERAPGSYRISIRGSSLRSPFGIRNVKVYWNGIPFTEPSGSTFLNLLDVFNMQQAEVIKGPSGSIYGAGNGGVILLESTTPVFQDRFTSSYSFGSFNSYNRTLAYQDHLDNGELSFKYSEQHTDGYREQSFLDRRVLEVSGNTEYATDRILSASILYSELNYGIPGGLNESQFDDDPRQARPGNPFVLGSVDANASILQEALVFGIEHEYQITDRFFNAASAFGTFSDFENPFNFDYKVDSRKSGGFRTVYKYQLPVQNSMIEFTAGSEYQASSYASRNYGNDSGSIGTLNFDDELKVQSLLAFASANIELPNNWFIDASFSYNDVEYEINRLFSADSTDYGLPGIVVKEFDPQFIPRLGIAKRVTPAVTTHASIGYGFSPPTIEEIRTNEGSINLGLEPEKGLNMEYGVRGSALNARLLFDVVFFSYRLDDSIVQQDTERGTAVFLNAGSTIQNGLEVGASYYLIESSTSWMERAQLNLSFTHHNFEFDEYVTNDGDFSGNDLTGVTPNNLITSFSFDTKPGLYGSLSYNFTDRIPLEDDNSVYSDSYQLLQTKIGIKRVVREQFETDLYAGIDNLLNESYSLGFDINAFGSRYFQPAPKRNWFIGLKVNWLL